MNDSRDGSERAPPGWYPDPSGSGNLLYWDGTRWTGDAHTPTAPAATPPESRLGRLGRPRMLIGGGGAAFAVSPFLTWVKVILLGNLSLFQLFDAAGRGYGWAWAAVLGGGAAAFVALREGSLSTVRVTGLAVGLLGGALAVYALVDLRHGVDEANGLAAIGIGPYVAVGGCVAMVAGGAIDRAAPLTRR